MTTTHFWLIRHGETQWNAERRLQGWRDIALNDTGIQQARSVARYLDSDRFTPVIDVVVSSDLDRAMQTARIGAHHLPLPIHAEPGLRERCYGIYEGQYWAELTDEQAQKTGLNLRDPDQAVEKGETLAQFQARVIGAFEDLAQRHSQRNILVFTHGGVIDIVWRKATQTLLQAPRLDRILNASVNQFAIDADSAWRLTDWGQATHLTGDALDDVV
jgi:probable phosphoglycerate mutase